MQYFFLVFLLVACPLALSAKEIAPSSTTELKEAWLALAGLKNTKEVSSAKKHLRAALAAVYSSEGKELKALWLQTAAYNEITSSIKAQKKHEVKDFPYPPSLYHVWVQKFDDKFVFSSRNRCIRFYEVTSDVPEYKVCQEQLAHVKVDGEMHQLPQSFPTNDVLKNEYQK